MHKELKQAWLEKLREPDRAQTRFTLKRVDPSWGGVYNDEEFLPGQCCLGVFCDVLIEKFPGVFKWENDEDIEVLLTNGKVSSATTLGHISELAGVELDRAPAPGESFIEQELANKNDRGATFPEIADWIETNVPEDEDVPLEALPILWENKNILFPKY